MGRLRDELLMAMYYTVWLVSVVWVYGVSRWNGFARRTGMDKQAFIRTKRPQSDELFLLPIYPVQCPKDLRLSTSPKELEYTCFRVR